MPYGTGEYGTGGFGSFSFDQTGPSPVVSDPLNGAVSVPLAQIISFTLTSPAGLDPNSLDVDLNGAQAIVGGVFRPGFSGTIVFEGEDCDVAISTNPGLLDGRLNTVAISITDLAQLSATPSFSFNVDEATVTMPQTLALSEASSFGQTLSVTPSETPVLTENLEPSVGTTGSVGETLNLGDGVTGDVGHGASVSETLVLSEGQTVQLGNTLLASESLALGESHVAVAGRQPTASETLGLTENSTTLYGAKSTVSEPVGLTEGLIQGDEVSVGESLTLSEQANLGFSGAITTPETVSFTEQFGLSGGYTPSPSETLTLQEVAEADSFRIDQPTNTTLQVNFPLELDLAGSADLFRYSIMVLDPQGVPATVTGIQILQTVHQSSTGGSIVNQGGILSNQLALGGGFDAGDIGDYIELLSPSLNSGRLYRIVGIAVDEPIVEPPLLLLDPENGNLSWRHLSGVQGVLLDITLTTAGIEYQFSVEGLKTKIGGQPFSISGTFVSETAKPQVTSSTFLDDGTILVNFDQDMRFDSVLASTDEYSVTGPTTVRVKQVRGVSPRTIAIETVGLSFGSYTLTVNATGTPKDIAGNPIDPTFNQAIFTSSPPLTSRSVFTDKGPITKPPLTVQSGINATLDTFTDVTLPGAALIPDHVGLYINLTGGVINGGQFRIISVLSATTARLKASFTLPDPNSGSLNWELIDPRNGQIADDPSDVEVRINTVPVTPDAVIGLLGQIVLSSPPLETDDVKVDYHWICNPTVDVRRLNSKEFRLNSWNRDVGYPLDSSQHKYRFNNTLIRPSSFVPDDMQALLDQPLLREMHYRAYERAYTPVLNDPTLLVLNTPIHRIAYPQMRRQLAESFIRYEALVLPENNTAAPWTRRGSGSASVLAGVLTLNDTTTEVFPTGQPIYWTREVDLSFNHVFAMAWRFQLDVVTTFEGVFTGIAAGYSDDKVAVIFGCIEDGGVKKIGFLKRGGTDDPSPLSSWIGGLDGSGNPTGLPADFDWSVLHTYRIFRDPSGVIRLYVDGDVSETLRILPDELPFLEELNAPFDAIQDVFFGSVSRPARNTSRWDFVRYLSIPLNPEQVAPSAFVSYEANVVPEDDAKPWTPIGFHGTETIITTDFLLLDSTSASDAPTSTVGLMGSDFRGFARIEPLLPFSSEVILDVQLDVRTHTHGVDPNAIMAAVDDGDRLIQLSFFPNKPSPKKSYGGRSFPEDFSPYVWSALGTATVSMAGRILRITDTDIGDGKVYFINDTASPVPTAPDRIVLATTDYILEFRSQVSSYTPDGAGFSGVFSQVFDGTRAVGVMLTEILGGRYVSLTSDGADLGPTSRFAFDWFDGKAHTYRISKNTTGDLVSLFVDGIFLGSFTYSSFLTPPPDTVGQISFGSSTPASAAALSTVDWTYCNVWRVLSDQKHYVGLWKGFDPNSLTGYHLPLKASGKGAFVTGNALGDTGQDFFAAGVVAGDLLVVDVGPNKGVYEVAGVSGPTSLTIVGTWPTSPTNVDYRIAKETDWTVQHKYRIAKNTTGDIVVLLDADPTPLIETGYSSLELPASTVGVVNTLTSGLGGIAFGAFSPSELSQSSWDFVRYGITRSQSELRIVPHHQFLNQWNVMSSPEHLFTTIPHEHTDFKSSSTGIPPKKDPDFFNDPNLIAFTLLNEGTPLVPQTQTFEVRAPFPIQEFVSALNRPEDVLNNDGDFVLNDGSKRFKLIVPDDVLYSCLDIIEQQSGTTALITPFCDNCGVQSFSLEYVNEVCLEYEGDVLPEDDTTASTPWSLVSDNPAEVSTSVFSSILTYGTGPLGTRTVYRNDTPLPDATGLQTEATFRLKLLNDSTGGTGDTQVRFGVSAPGFTIALAFVTTVLAERYVLAVDLNSGNVLGSSTFDFLDGNFHTYRIVRDPAANQIRIFIDA